MKLINVPTRQPVPFAANAATANKRAIPATQPAGSPGYASYSTGFPPETMQPIASGGTPPFGQDFNGLFFDVTNELRWVQAGGTYAYDSAFSASIGGYPSGAVLKSAAAPVLWISTADDNTTDPDGASAAGWVAFRPNSGRAALVVAAGTIIPTAAQLLSSLLSITGDATNLTTTLQLPLVAGASYLINNATTGTGSTFNVQGATGTGVAVAQGQATAVFCDGTNYYSVGSSGAGQYLPINGTAVAATKLATARAFNLTGIITATAVNFDGTGNVTLNTAIADGTLTIAKTNGLQTALDGKQATLGFTPVQQGTGVGQSANVVKIGWKAGSKLGATIDSTDIGNFAMEPWVSANYAALSGCTFTGALGAANGSAAGITIERAVGQLGARIWKDTSATDIWYFDQLNGSDVVFRTSGNVERFRVQSGGGVLITGNANATNVNAASFGSTNTNWIAGPSGAGTMYLRPNGVGSATGQSTIDSSGNFIASGTVRGGSDARVKVNVRPIKNALTTVRRALVGVTYQRTDQDGAFEVGFIADEVQVELPHLVSQSEMNGYKDFKTMDYMHTTAYLAAAITELEDRLAAQARWTQLLGVALAAVGAGLFLLVR